MPSTTYDKIGTDGTLYQRKPLSYNEVSIMERGGAPRANTILPAPSGTSRTAVNTVAVQDIFGSTQSTYRLGSFHFTFELARDSPTTKRNLIKYSPIDYNFVIRSLNFAVAKKRVSHTALNLKTTLWDEQGNEILEIRKQPSIHTIFSKPKIAALQKFEVYNRGNRIGLITFDSSAPSDKCLKIFHADNSTQLVVKSLAKGEISVFRDQSSQSLLCKIRTFSILLSNSSFNFSGLLDFCPHTGITTEEQRFTENLRTST